MMEIFKAAKTMLRENEPSRALSIVVVEKRCRMKKRRTCPASLVPGRTSPITSSRFPSFDRRAFGLSTARRLAGKFARCSACCGTAPEQQGGEDKRRRSPRREHADIQPHSRPLPYTMPPRTLSAKYVSGNTFDTGLSQSGSTLMSMKMPLRNIMTKLAIFAMPM